ncbi:rRNA methyltransferase 3, mitochondrial-like [Panonychus citri]|uniref:rRNA methyltransferase 3, mitochondrial-like n=1 Tax=Panonychus citri TaxID=50023 RepID=UPI002307DB8D|nr:rRNA methyltransferase 3, mitochondrial-like [Panonychus citri]
MASSSNDDSPHQLSTDECSRPKKRGLRRMRSHEFLVETDEEHRARRYREYIKFQLEDLQSYIKYGLNGSEKDDQVTDTASKIETLEITGGDSQKKQLYIIHDGLQCGLKLDKLFFTKESILQGIPELETLLTAAYMGEYKDHGPVLIKVTPNMMNRLSDVQTPPGIIGLFAKPTSSSESSATRNCGIPVTLIGDNIRDPGNMGTLIRSSASIGVERIICTKGCANPWESKVVRSGAGAHFRCNLITDFEWSTLPTLLPPKDSTLIFAEKTKSQTNELTSSSTLSSRNYFDLDYPQFIDSDKKLALIIGGETEGISDEALALTNLYQRSYKVNIPILKGIDSLNSAIAGSIILFEIQRQIIKGIAK